MLPELYTLSLHDALPIYIPGFETGVGGHDPVQASEQEPGACQKNERNRDLRHHQDRKSTRLNSSHPSISYAVFCLKKKKAKVVRMYWVLLESQATLRPTL